MAAHNTKKKQNTKIKFSKQDELKKIAVKNADVIWPEWKRFFNENEAFHSYKLILDSLLERTKPLF